MAIKEVSLGFYESGKEFSYKESPSLGLQYLKQTERIVEHEEEVYYFKPRKRKLSPSMVKISSLNTSN